ncbi:MAG: M4 family metallopeptidase [Candidatus Zixiibacteriota bacterium]
MRIAPLVLLLLLAASVAQAAGPTQLQAGIDRLKTQPGITVLQDEESGRLRFVAGRLSDPVSPGAEIAEVYRFLENQKSAYQMKDAVQEIQVKRVDLDPLGMRHIRLRQVHEGLRVYGAEMIAHFAPNGVLNAINGTYLENVAVSPTPQLSGDQARDIAVNDLATFFGGGQPNQPELLIYPWEGKNYLAYRLEIFSGSPMGRWEYFVDARSGEVIFKANRIMDVDAIGTGTSVMGGARNHIDTDFDGGATYYMVDNTRQAANNPHGHGGQMPLGNVIQTFVAGASLPGSIATDADNVWSEAAQASSVDGHVYSALMYDWLLGFFGRNSFDNAGASMYTSVDYSAEGNNNAYWNGIQIVVWSWGTGFRSLAGCPDVIAHEWAHAVTENESGLIYQKESGALNESYSDMMGAAFEFAHDSLDTPDWLVGENGQISGGYFRDMSNPPARSDPDYYGGTFWVNVVGCTPSSSNDYCGVHTNSGVGNKWFYLLSDGGTHHSVTVTGLGVETAIQIAYRANSFYWTPLSTYSEAAYGTILAARDLDQSGVWEQEVRNAWTAVGVGMPSPYLVFTYPNGKPSLLTPGQPATFEVIVGATFDGSVLSGSGGIYYRINGGTIQSAPMTELGPGHFEATLPAVYCGQRLEYMVEAFETTQGQFLDPGQLQWFLAEPGTDQTTLFEDDFETNKGWVADAGWARGTPTGGGGEYGGPDPSSAYSGTNVFGFNLAGDYDNNMPARHLTSPAIDCSSLTNVHINFQRWLGVEQPIYDRASISVSTDGLAWTTVWENPTEIADFAWTFMDVNISAVASGEPLVYVRFTMGPTDGGWRFCGWNIDDFRVTAYQCVGGADSDVDGIPDDLDNCPSLANPGQEDSDGDTVGDLCDQCAGFDDLADADSDQIADGCDNCPQKANPGQEDGNGDGIGDACCCVGIVGDANTDGGFEPTIGDVTTIIDHLFVSGMPLNCYAEADINQSGGAAPQSGDLTIGDITVLIDYLFVTGPTMGLPSCL